MAVAVGHGTASAAMRASTSGVASEGSDPSAPRSETRAAATSGGGRALEFYEVGQGVDGEVGGGATAAFVAPGREYDRLAESEQGPSSGE